MSKQSFKGNSSESDPLNFCLSYLKIDHFQLWAKLLYRLVVVDYCSRNREGNCQNLTLFQIETTCC